MLQPNICEAAAPEEAVTYEYEMHVSCHLDGVRRHKGLHCARNSDGQSEEEILAEFRGEVGPLLSEYDTVFVTVEKRVGEALALIAAYKATLKEEFAWMRETCPKEAPVTA